MGVFDQVFAQRGEVEVAKEQVESGAFGEVFVRRGRWRNQTSAEAKQPVAIEAEVAESSDARDCLKEDNCNADPEPSQTTEAMHLIIKNTFIDGNDGDLSWDSLKEFLHERKVQTCPADCVNSSFDLIDAESTDAEDGPLDASFRTVSNYGDAEPVTGSQEFEAFNTASNYGDIEVPRLDSTWLETASIFGDSDHAHADVAYVRPDPVQISLGDALCAGTAPDDAPVPQTLFTSSSADMAQTWFPPPPAPFEVAPVAAPVLRLAEAVAPPELGSQAMPSVGSMLHHNRECKPCTFFHTRGCENGQDCQFCHLCGPGEKKKRLRQQRAQKREAKAAVEEHARTIIASFCQNEEASYEEDMIVE